MKYTQLVLISLLLSLFLTIAGCTSQPTEQAQLAQKAMDQAKEQRAEEFAPADWKNALQAWEDAQSLIAQQKYGEAGSLLLRAKSRFEKARDIARAKREDLRREIEGAQKTIDRRHESLKAAVAAAKLSPAAKKGLEESSGKIVMALDKLNAELQRGEYVLARTTSQTALGLVYQAEKELEKGTRKQ